jgi:phospholipase C
MKIRTKVSIAIPFLLLAVLLTANIAANANPATPPSSTTATPIKHVVVIFQENVSTDHYFATYPNAANPPNEPQFTAAADTPSMVGLSGPLLTDNPNAIAASGGFNSQYNPTRLDRSEPVTCDNDHDYEPEQKAYNGGLVNQFPENTGCSNGVGTYDDSIVMDYYDGNTVTALWNYAQNFALNDNSFGTTFGPSTPGALNVVSGLGGPAQITSTTTAPTSTGTGGAFSLAGATVSTANVAGTLANGQIIGDIDPTYDDCSYSQDGSTSTGAMVSTGADVPLNIGNLLNDAGVTWGWFQGGFTPTVSYNPTTGAPAQCGESEAQVGGTTEAAYSPHHEPFQYFASTANPHHLPPSSASTIGYTDQANHQYDISSFWVAADAGNLPAVSYLKAPRYQDGHPANSDPLDEQTWLVNTINKLMSLPTWSSTAIIINWDDSDGWYDSVMPTIISPSSDPTNDALNGPGQCGQGTSPLGVEDRCGSGPRIPILVISPYAKSNYIDSTFADQTSIVSFIEYNWNLNSVAPNLLGPQSFDTISGSIMNMFDFSHPQPNDGRVFLNPSTGEVVQSYLNVGSGSFGSGQYTQSTSSTPGTPNLSTTQTCTDVDTNPDVCATENDFSNSAIATGDDVWFSAAADITPRESASPLTVHFTGQWLNVQLTGDKGIPLSIPAPNSEVVFSSTATSETTTYTGGQWVTTVPVGFTGNVFIGGVAYQVPAGVSLAGAKADWTGVFSGTTTSFTLTWEWAVAVYSTLGTGLGTGIGSSSGTTAFYNALGVNPNSASLTSNPAGTPENFVSDYLSSATVGTYHGSSGPYTGAYNQPGNAYYQTYLLNE